MQLAQRISLPVRAALAANCADTPLAGHFLYRGDAALFSGVHRLRRDRFERLCGNVCDVMAQHGKLAHFDGLDVGDENSAGFREIYEFIVAHWEEIALLLRVILSVLPLLMDERRQDWRPAAEGVPLKPELDAT